MSSEKQYIDLYKQTRQMICEHSSDVMNAVRDDAFERFAAAGFPSKKVERYKYEACLQSRTIDWFYNPDTLSEL